MSLEENFGQGLGYKQSVYPKAGWRHSTNSSPVPLARFSACHLYSIAVARKGDIPMNLKELNSIKLIFSHFLILIELIW